MAKATLNPSSSPMRSLADRIAKHRGLIVPLGFISLMIVILVPMPAWLMDILICLNISISVIVLLTTIYMEEPLEFSVFPSLLLGLTLFRLVLNIATTRLILTADAASPDQAIGVAGHVISAFANFVAGDSLFVGIVIFLILLIVQFVVITKGATRISEVAARFTLDAMPGKQMAIDADLSSGSINEQEARTRRERISQEADFFGAMDGASKFVRGDAIAGIIITVINVLGGFAIGMIERGWPVGQTARVFTLLTIGDGLTSQIPSFVVAIASALIVTRSGSKQQLGEQLASQLISKPIGLWLTAGFLCVLAVTPLPKAPLLGMALVLATTAWWMGRTVKRLAATTAAAQAATVKATPDGPPPESLLKVDALELEVGYGLVGLVDAGQGGDLLERITAVRRQLAVELGFILPPVRIRDNMQLAVHEYRIKIKGAVVAKGQTIPGRLMAMDSGIASGPIQGEQTREPAFGLDAWWIEPALRVRAETMNYTVVDPTSVLATHLTEVVKQHAAELLSREEVNNLITGLKEKAPKLVEEVIPSIVKPGELQRVLQNLLKERVPIRDVESVVETLAEWGPKTKDLDVLTEYARNALRRTICQLYAVPSDLGEAFSPGSSASAPGEGAVGGASGAGGAGGAVGMGGRIVCITLDPDLQELINAYVDRSTGSTSFNMPARVSNQVSEAILKAIGQLVGQGHQPVLLASPQIRAVVRQLIEPHLPNAAVLGYNEIVNGVEIESVAMVGVPSGVAASLGQQVANAA